MKSIAWIFVLAVTLATLGDAESDSSQSNKESSDRNAAWTAERAGMQSSYRPMVNQ